MKSMTLTTTVGVIPTSIIELATEINSRIGDQNITVCIHDEVTGREYKLEPNERRNQHDTQRSDRSRRTLCAGNS